MIKKETVEGKIVYVEVTEHKTPISFNYIDDRVAELELEKMRIQKEIDEWKKKREEMSLL